MKRGPYQFLVVKEALCLTAECLAWWYEINDNSFGSQERPVLNGGAEQKHFVCAECFI